MSRSKTAWMWFSAMLLTAIASVWLKPQLDPTVQIRAAEPLEDLFPSAFGDWALDPSAVAPIRPAFDVARRFQMYDQVLERTYVNAKGERIMMSVAYGRQQSVGLQMHRPEVCYKAGGFTIDAVHAFRLPMSDRHLPVTRLFAHMDGRPEPITYWRLLGEEVMDDESGFKLQTWSWRGGALVDGLLVRVSTIDAVPEEGWQAQARFIDQLTGAMSPAQRARVLGQH